MRRAALVSTLGLLVGAPAAAQTDGARPSDAMAFIRVVGDLRADQPRDARLNALEAAFCRGVP